jgi:hypothetical protein
MNNQLELIEKIHQDFDTAQERLLSEAKRILEGVKTTEMPTVETAKRLKLFGFINTPIAKRGAEIIEKIEMSKKEAKLIQYYMKEYPFLKFLTVAELDRICQKYNLMYATVDRYTKDVPIRNLEDIERAKSLKYGDEEPNRKWVEISKFWEGNDELKSWLKAKGGKIFITTIKTNGQEPTESSVRDGILEMGYKGGFGRWIFEKATIFEEKREGLFIAAPESHFNLKGLEKNGFGFFEVKRTEIKDPIVFRFVRGGVQVLTKWGLEAEDPSLILPINN